jgi:DNA-binding NarL/FixJ family response regulator
MVIVSDQLLMLSALSAALDTATETQYLASSSETEAVNLLRRNTPATLICTSSLKTGCSMNLAKSAKEIEGISIILIISSKSDLGLSSKMLEYCDAMIAEWDLDHNDQPLTRAFEAISAKPATYCSPSINNYLSSIQQQVATLTPREKAVLDLILAGFSNQDIADQLTISTSTAKSYSRDVLRKLGVKNRHEAVLKGIKLGLVVENQ